MNRFIQNIKKNYRDYLLGLIIILLLGVVVFNTSYLGTSQSFDAMSRNNMEYSYSKSLDVDGSGDYGGSNGVVERKVIRNANLELETDKFDSTKSNVDILVGNYNAIILDSNERRYRDSSRRVNYRIKVNSNNLDEFLGHLKTYGEVENVRVYKQDVTDSFTDYTNRLNRYKTQITKYELMLTKPNLEIKEEIEIQIRIDQLEDNIFMLQNRINLIDKNVVYSMVNLNVREEESFSSKVDFVGFKDGVIEFVRSISSSVEFILVVFGFILPFLCIYGIYRIGKRIIHHK